MDYISIEDIQSLQEGDKLTIVDGWNRESNNSPDGSMDKYLGTTLTVKSIIEDLVSQYLYGICNPKVVFEECPEFNWNRYCILPITERRNPKEFVNDFSMLI